MSIATYIRDKTDDGRNIARFLIDVMDGNIDGSTLTHRLAAARLLTIYGHDDAPDFIADNTPDNSEQNNGHRIWIEIDEGLRNLIKVRTDDGRVICMFLIDVVEGKFEDANVGHRVSAARELLSRAFGKAPGKSLPKAKATTTPRRSTQKSHVTPESARSQATVDERPVAQTAVLVEPEQLTERKLERMTEEELAGIIFRAASKCTDPNFDPMRAATDDDYFMNYDGCDDIRCYFHGDPEDLGHHQDPDPNDHHY